MPIWGPDRAPIDITRLAHAAEARKVVRLARAQYILQIRRPRQLVNKGQYLFPDYEKYASSTRP
jgi:hypothetical protein